MSETLFQIIFATTLGLLVGSFLNVVISRLPARMMWQWRQDAREFLEQPAAETDIVPPGVVVKRSFCPSCQNPIAAYDNIPLISYLLLGGKCRHCKTSISFQYPLVELSMAILAGASVWLWGWNIQALVGSAFFAVMLVCSAIDFKTQLLPDHIVLPALWAALLWAAIGEGISPVHSIIGASAGYLILWSVFWLFKLVTGKEGMGYGDFKLLALIGAFAGPGALLPTILLASVMGAIVGSVLVALKGKSQPFAFGPYLALGAVTYILFQQPILNLHIFPTF